MDEGQKKARKSLRSYTKERSGGRHYQKGVGRMVTKAARASVDRQKVAEGVEEAEDERLRA